MTDATRAGVQPSALLTAAYINFGFNIINRVADALGVTLERTADLSAAARWLLFIGYRPLSGKPFTRALFDPRLRDPYEPLVATLRTTALRGVGSLPFGIRKALYEDTAEGRVGEFGRAVAERAWTITPSDLDALLNEGTSEDEVFEATICAALGASTRRLDPFLRALRAVSGARETVMR